MPSAAIPRQRSTEISPACSERPAGLNGTWGRRILGDRAAVAAKDSMCTALQTPLKFQKIVLISYALGSGCFLIAFISHFIVQQLLARLSKIGSA